MNDIQIFKHEDFGQVRVVYKDNESWFIGMDITEKLGYQNGSRDINRHTDEEDREEVNVFDGIQNRKMIAINESGLYSLILSSKLAGAKKFKRWVTSEVLPQIRKTGGYIPMNEEENEQDILAKALLIAQNTLKKRDELLKAKDKELGEKNRFLNQISASSNSILVRDVAHLATKNNLKIGEKRLWNKLREWGLIQKNSTKPMQRALEQGLFEKSEFVIQRSNGVETKFTTRVTGKGQVYIIKRLLEEEPV
ncbi:BRO family protein [Clostridium tertium]|uniref:phage antirepressor n=1 Tax=Clostridium tertium TaxID=1559 RepID=UPI00232F4572|nr:phage antirepressor KilAC domain-containing protein [Clostridium tertium]MDB1923364.1 BRO family protein [Clostridium tertium]MDB1929969.1 BRO family protein [Clostridium tertium]